MEHINSNIDKIVKELAERYNHCQFFQQDPIIFPKHFTRLFRGECGIFNEAHQLPDKVSLADIEIAGIIAAHLAWGRRDMIVRDTKRALDQMNWRPFEYVMNGNYRDDNTSLHRTIKWSEFAMICKNLRAFYTENQTIEELNTDEIRVKIYGQKSDPKGACKKIHMFKRWMVRDDGIVDLGIWKKISPADLIIPLDVHVHRSALEMGITKRKSADYRTALEITEYLKRIFPDDPCKGDFALFAYAATIKNSK